MPGALALPSTCLRCQLRAAVWQTTTLQNLPKHVAKRCQAFSTHRLRLQETANVPIKARYKGGTKWRSIALSDGKHEARPKPIIVLEDIAKSKGKVKDNSPSPGDFVVEGKSGQEDAGHSPSAKQIESMFSEKHKAPAQADVNASLEAIRVEVTKASTVLSASSFEALLQDLGKSYTLHQLGRYLDRSIQSPSKKVYELQTTPWRSGRTALERRHPKQVREKGRSTKLRIAEQIIRLVWEITVESEENRDGELEIRLKPWQVSLLFDLTSNGARYVEGLITPQTLVQNGEIQVYRPDNVMRITGRYQTAEEIARQIKLALLKVHRLQWDMNHLAPSSKLPGKMPTPIFRPVDVEYVTQLTGSVIVPEHGDVLAIYSTSRLGTLNARRLLLALLDRTQASFSGFAATFDEAADTTCDIPIGNSKIGIHRRYHGLELLRTVKPVKAKNARAGDDLATAQGWVNEHAIALASQLDLVLPPRLVDATNQRSDSYWRDQGFVSAWKAKFCTLLHSKSQPLSPVSGEEGSRNAQSIVQHAIPGLESLLSYFDASKDSRLPQWVKKVSTPKHPPESEEELLPYMKVHLRPSPQDPSSASSCPRLEMRFHFAESKHGSNSRELMLTGMQAVVDEQRLSVPLPGHTADVQFTRNSKLLAKLDSVKADANIMAFVRQLQKSAQRGKGALTAPAELLVKLPQCLAGQNDSDVSAAGQDFTVKYLFERFEQIERLGFTPRDSAMREPETNSDLDVVATLKALPKHLRLDYREIEGGAIFGNSTVLSLEFDRRRRGGMPSNSDVEETSRQTDVRSYGNSSLDVAGATLRIAHLLTRATSSSLKRSGETANES